MAKNNKTVDRIQAVWNILGGEEGVGRLIRGEITISEPERVWREQNGVIYFSVISDNESGEGWINRLESKGFRLDDYAKQLLRSEDFKPTNGVIYEIAVLKSTLFEENSNRVTKKIRAKAEGRGLTKPNAEVACLIGEKFSDDELKAMRLSWIVTMHEPIEDFGGDSHLLSANSGDGGRWLQTYDSSPDSMWCPCWGGFAFAVSPQ